MYKPNYRENNIVNLMSTIALNLGTKTAYNALKLEDLSKHKNIVLLIIDGLGYNYLMGKDSFLKDHLHKKLEGAFPLTTAASNTVFSFGVPVQQHGLTGWFVYLKEIGVITTVLPFTERYGGSSLYDLGFDMKSIIGVEPFTKNADRSVYKLLDEKYAFSNFSRSASVGATIIGVKPYKETFKKIKELSETDEKKYIHAYIGDLDSSGHEIGMHHEDTGKIFADLDNHVKELKDLEDTIILVTADHGMVDTEEPDWVCLNDYEEIYDCLSMPLSGDTRIGYCYIKAGKEGTFMTLVHQQLGDKFLLFRSDSMIENGWFGEGEPHPNLKHRVGDFTLLAKANYVIYDNLQNQPHSPHLGQHSGISDDEVYVPLCIIK